jgi:hypothetical protein
MLLMGAVAAGIALQAVSAGADPTRAFPVLVVTEPALGMWTFEGVQPQVQVEVPGGTLLHFSWQGDASGYGGTIDAYRFGWDLVNPDDDAQWEQPWSPTATSAPARSFATGTHRLSVQVRDHAQLVTFAQIEIRITTVPVETSSWSRIRRLYAQWRP